MDFRSCMQRDWHVSSRSIQGADAQIKKHSCHGPPPRSKKLIPHARRKTTSLRTQRKSALKKIAVEFKKQFHERLRAIVATRHWCLFSSSSPRSNLFFVVDSSVERCSVSSWSAWRYPCVAVCSGSACVVERGDSQWVTPFGLSAVSVYRCRCSGPQYCTDSMSVSNCVSIPHVSS